jgi:hypothetical protein
MDPFAVIIFGGIGLLLAALLLLGRFYPGTGADQVDWRPTRSVELEVELELHDVEQMLEAQNVRRRARGQSELTEETIQQRVEADQREAGEWRDAYLAGADVQQMLEATNVRRRRRGLPELSEAQLQAELGQAPSD